MLDAREKWGVLLSLTAIAGLLHLLSDQSHFTRVNVAPAVIGVFGTFFVLVVNCYNKQAEAIANAQTEIDKEKNRSLKWYKYALRIKTLGWLHILAPIVIGTFAMLMLFFGIPSSIQSISNGGKRMSFSENIQIWTLVIAGLGAVAAIIAVVGVWWAARTFKFNTWLKAQAIYTADKFTESREAILSGYPVVLRVPLSVDDKKHALRVCRKMDELAWLRHYGLSDRKILEAWGKPMGKAWIVLEKVIEEQRSVDAEKWKNFEEIAIKAIKRGQTA